MSIYLIGVILSIIVYMIVGWYAGTKVKDVNDYYVSGRNAPTILITGTLFASMLSTNGFMGDTGFCYTGNITTMILLNVLCGSGYIFGPIFFGRYLRRTEINTMPEYFGKRFNDTKIQRFAGIITVISLTAYLLACIQGVGILMQELTGFSRITCLLISWACFTSFTFYSGSSGVILTDTMMFLIFIFATLVGAPYVFEAQGGLSQLIPNLMANPATPEGLLAFTGNIAGTGGITPFDAVMYALTVGVIWLVTVSVSPWQAGRNLMARNEHVTFRAGTISAILTTLFLTFLYMMAIAIININPNMADSQRVIIWACYNVMPKIIGVFVMTGIMAAGLSSASTFLSVIGFSLTNDIFGIQFKDDKAQLKTSRFIMLGVGVVALVLAYFNLGGVRIISWFASTIIAAAWGVAAFGSIWSKKMTAKGALWAMYGGFLGYLIPKCLKEFAGIPFKNLLDPFFMGIIISILCAYLGSKSTQRSKEEVAFYDHMHITPESEKKPEDYKRDKMYGWILIGAGVATTAILLIFWALPYNGLI